MNYTLPSSLQSYAAANYNIVNKVSSAAFTTADQSDGYLRAYRAGVSRRLGKRFTTFAEANRTTFNLTEARYTGDKRLPAADGQCQHHQWWICRPYRVAHPIQPGDRQCGIEQDQIPGTLN